MNLNELRPAEGSKRERRRVGRGHGTGWGKTAGKGHNGQKQRSGTYVSPIFEGGQMPIIRRVPKRGFSNAIFKKEYTVISLAFLNENFEDGEEVSLETLFNKCLIKKGRDGVKVLGNGELNKKLTVKVHKISKSAKAAVEAKGGTVELVEVKGFERAETNK